MYSKIINHSNRKTSQGTNIIHKEFGQQFHGVRYLNHLETAPYTEKALHSANSVPAYELEFIDLVSGGIAATHAKSISSATLANVYIQYVSEQIGYGVFAHSFHPAGSFIGIYTGIIEFEDNPHQSLYAIDYKPKNLNNSGLVIDASSAGNVTRFINDSPEPNVVAKHVYYEGQWHVIILAIKDILPNRQLLLDYGEAYFLNHRIERQHLLP